MRNYTYFKVNYLHPLEVLMQSSCTRIFHHFPTSSYQNLAFLMMAGSMHLTKSSQQLLNQQLRLTSLCKYSALHIHHSKRNPAVVVWAFRGLGAFYLLEIKRSLNFCSRKLWLFPVVWHINPASIYTAAVL